MNEHENISSIAARARKMAMQCPVLVALQGEKFAEPMPMDEFTITNSRTGKTVTTYYPAGALQGVELGWVGVADG